ncbi:bifunctional adenosylcobinamide kinase/adenosylcobinamide-phosphate guanylyltransferase [Pseudooceanicola sediminis]|uniref:Bifunctional adenosylcobalamin biosynthesis protein n=1 Tax=Pseudooceanicola sediminis TaxID=2211117 RepID=A0A399J6R4_9RHOB|nr:bifunctional adenosylcobinamide kinase/adenosylcobinamide-phosphate guanylyltransferase [Pseudooceanicola sediminis]KAA2314172.1 bifunctional adenosylcobinamide kinase/adenosylcobinamide-phosphate guanylyltransferase [Puniceibacterium sp. HSS470]RII39969.1 bifunctional adenosylcobinamide kinase/adenosylcobinamide-phosphate guanylyltransferase [Pseudooceanicola sediminis]|tara:strand:- start:24697 stop:25215 length:519 start_codon:yes stop_codon:yes gene_type:complete
MSGTKVLILGGAASGKSEFAEETVCFLGSEWRYIATAHALDDEMRTKVARHAARRGAGWQVIEAPLDLAPELTSPDRRPILFDCATMWLSNHMFAGSDLSRAQGALLDAIAACPAPVVTVTNEVGQGIVPENALSRQFREAQGRLNIALAQQADCVVQVIAGLPNVLKGSLP